jgi:hypothetical protein
MLTTSPFAIIIIVEVESLCLSVDAEESADLEVSDPIFDGKSPPTAKNPKIRTTGRRRLLVVFGRCCGAPCININYPR